MRSLSERFWSKVEKTDGCWLWLGNKSNGYGTIRAEKRQRRATHVAIYFATGNWPEPGKVVCHRCDNPPCVNPDHLFVGTHQDNARDAVQKGRHITYFIPAAAKPRGERHGRTTLTEDQVREIRASILPQRKLAAEFGVDQTTISAIRRRETWSHVE